MDKPRVRCWAIDHQPKTLKKCEDLQLFPAKILQGIVKNESFPHIFIFGLSGGGKRTLINCFLQDLLNHMKRKTTQSMKNQDDDSDATEEDEIKEEFKPFYNLTKNPTKLKEDTDLHILQSDIHIELSMCSMKLQSAQTILFQYLEEIGQNKFLKFHSKVAKFPFTIIWIKDCSYMTYVTQKAIGILMESYGHKLKFILTSEHFHDIEISLASRCNTIHVSLPTHDKVAQVLTNIIELEDLPPETLKPNWVNMCVKYSERNLRTAIQCFQSTYYSSDGILALPQWKKELFGLCQKIFQDNSIENLDKLLLKIEEYLCCFMPGSPGILLGILKDRFLMHPKLTDKKKYQIVGHCALVEKRMKSGLNPYVHLAYFCCETCKTFESPIFL